jgi:hypothetical protein
MSDMILGLVDTFLEANPDHSDDFFSGPGSAEMFLDITSNVMKRHGYDNENSIQITTNKLQRDADTREIVERGLNFFKVITNENLIIIFVL